MLTGLVGPKQSISFGIRQKQFSNTQLLPSFYSKQRKKTTKNKEVAGNGRHKHRYYKGPVLQAGKGNDNEDKAWPKAEAFRLPVQ